MRIWIAGVVVLGILAAGAYGLRQGTPQDVVDAVRTGDVEALQAALRRDPASARTKVYGQAYETRAGRIAARTRTGQDPWEGRYLIHDAVEFAPDPRPVLEALAAGGADLAVRLHGRTLLHLAAAKGDVDVAAWLLDHGADPHAGIECDDGCAERGYTPLHSGLAVRDEEMTALLLARGAPIEAAGADGRTAMHVAARGKLSGALVLARHGADLARTDAAGKTPYELARELPPGAAPDTADVAAFARWFAPGGPFAAVSAMARATGTPISDDEARAVMASIGTTPP
ncbi:MAG: ankyrin repeat domain-containing protein [Vicinamibacterales bacterium]